MLYNQFWGLPSWSITFTTCLQEFGLKLFPDIQVQPSPYPYPKFLMRFGNCFYLSDSILPWVPMDEIFPVFHSARLFLNYIQTKKAPKHISVALNGQKTELWSYSTSTSFPFTSIFSKQITPQNWLLSVLLTAKNFLMLMIKYLRELLHQALSRAIFYTNALFRCNIMHCFTQESNIYF